MSYIVRFFWAFLPLSYRKLAKSHFLLKTPAPPLFHMRLLKNQGMKRCTKQFHVCPYIRERKGVKSGKLTWSIYDQVYFPQRI